MAQAARSDHGAAPTEEAGRGAADQRAILDRGPDPLIGRVIADRYRIVGHVGRGGMGVVYKVEHLRIGKLMAMKLLTGELSRSREVVRRFKREALAASRLTSVNTVQVWDFGHADGLTYLVMELVAGEDLGKILKREGPFDFRRVAQLAAQVCNSMEEAHQRGIVHRDIKPENILVLHPTGEGRQLTELVKVLDFGLAKLHDDERSHTNDVTTTGAIVGTPFYMAPEQIRGEAVDGRADIYALGAVMYRALTGVPPFEGATPMSVLTMHLTEPLIAPHERFPGLGIPREASEIIAKCMAKDRDERYASAAELREALVNVLATLGVSGGFLRSGTLEAVASREQHQTMRTSGSGRAIELATRREVNEYGKYRRRVSLVAAAVALGAAIGLVLFARGVTQTPVPRPPNEEIEPNDSTATATGLKIGTPAHGQIGKRLSPDRGDVDVWRFEVNGADPMPLIEIALAPLPNIPLCIELLSDPAAGTSPAETSGAVATFCRPRGKPLQVSAFRVPPGTHWLRVSQDRAPVEDGARPPVHENVSDSYALRVALAPRTPELEIEPNDATADAQALVIGEGVSAHLGWRGDRDVFCASGADGSARFVVEHRGTKGASALVAETLVGGVAHGRTEIAPGVEVWRGATFPVGQARCLAISAAADSRDDVTYRVVLEKP
ncbi:MAG: serine/threonine protein kinase [Deltaproteobacteria bacterium]|nr:serine/threonine protein kinase [Deltaproteobacteria bacterium]